VTLPEDLSDDTEDLRYLGHAASTVAAAREPPFARPREDHAAFSQERHVRLRRRVLPHLVVHGRRGHDGRRGRKRRERHHVWRLAMGEVCEEVGRRRGDHHDVGSSRDLDMRLCLVGREHVDHDRIRR
jgi:hypothetical protein